MGNKEVFNIIVLLAAVFAVLSVLFDLPITGSAVKPITKSISLNFSVITIVLIAVILISLVIELWKIKKYEE
ncbi:hypothetical protein HYX16_01645 [Candidatus Woesearchaeota archaeon]|nr:hypothetical protein [Candidatus Woesearchaeota archaeon]